VIRPILFLTAAAALRADSLEDILKRMDASAKTFQSVSAKLKQTSYTAALKETNDEGTGEMRLKRTKQGLIGVVVFAPPDERTFHFSGGKVEIYHPKSNSADIYDVGKHKSAIDRGLMLGFGTSGSDLQKEYSIKVLGSETVQSVPATHLDLTPKSGELRKLIMHIELWIVDGKSYPVQDKIVQPSNDYSIFVYSDVKTNPSLPNSAFELNLPAGVVRHEVK
jgi:outer membrane lipoprotein-sorting protein